MDFISPPCIWKKKYGGLEASELKRLKELEEENRRLKQMYADLSFDHKILKEVIEKKLYSPIRRKRLQDNW